MRIISWNCQGAFRNKTEPALQCKPDILVIQECENAEKIVFKDIHPTDFFWYSDDGKKGLGLFSFSDYRFRLMDEFDPRFRYILPIEVLGTNFNFTLMAIWAMNNKENRRARYIGQVWLAIQHYEKLLEGNVILMGDFNSNKIWDYKSRVGDHSDVVNKLEALNISSLYHLYYNQQQGEEKHQTLYMNRNIERSYHVDYCFASSYFKAKLKSLQIGDFNEWLKYSDHCPLIVDFNS
ncbi:MAG TPA: hypothetical protein PLK75_12585 [Bacteroidales bacterium]|nr:hypothetical protein [Bacteroidales bacterium]